MQHVGALLDPGPKHATLSSVSWRSCRTLWEGRILTQREQAGAGVIFQGSQSSEGWRGWTWSQETQTVLF